MHPGPNLEVRHPEGHDGGVSEAEAAPGLTVGTTVGNYRVEHKIGEGGMGAVYLAEHPLLGRKAAVKVLLPEHSKKFCVRRMCVAPDRI